ncbi:MAG TPA: response regulator [Gemmatimonadaceae bacterium]|nr:response regulator [Gemmatimonadaceae bacterium]
MEFRVAPPEGNSLRTVDVAGAPLGSAESHRSVLVVDDDPNLRLLVKAALARSSFLMDEAEDGVEALKRLDSHIPDLLLLDVNMPKMDGIAVLRKLRSETPTRDIPVILLTAQGDEKSVAAGFEAGATDYLVKPFTVPQLTARVRAALSRSAYSASAGE